MFIYSTAPLFGFNIAEQELMLPGTVLIWLIKVDGAETELFGWFPISFNA